MSLRNRITSLEKRDPKRLLVLFENEAAYFLEKRPKQQNEVIFVLPDEAKKL